MSGPVLFVLSSDEPLPPVFSPAREQGLVVPVRQDRLADRDIASAAGLIATAHVDQVDLMARKPALEALLCGGGRVILNGHVMRRFIDGLEPFMPLATPRRADYALTRLSSHPVFEGIAAESLETNRGVAGFYARGHNPPPAGAIALTGIGPHRLPVDWVWERPLGGAILVHSGNDLWSVGDDPDARRRIAERLVDWCLAAETAEAAS